MEAIQRNPDVPTMREDFLFSIEMKHEPDIAELKAWFSVEKNLNTIESYIFKIADTVISGRSYSEEDKVGMISRKATTKYNVAKQQMHTDPEIAIKTFQESLLLHLKAFKINAVSGSPMLDISEKYARNTSDQLFRILSSDARWRPLAVLPEIEENCDGYLDPVADPFIQYLEKNIGRAWFPDERYRTHNHAKKLVTLGFDSKKWMDTTIVPRIETSLRRLIEATRKK